MASKPTQKPLLPTRRSLFSEVDPFRDFFDRPLWVSRFFERPFGAGAAGPGTGWAPAMDVTETKDAYVVTLELPGTSKDDISIECHEKVLTIRGEKRSERDEKDEHRHYIERTFGSFTRTLRLPADASEEVRATFRDGVLTVSIPKVEASKPRVVAIEP